MPPQHGRRVQLHRALSKLGWGSRRQAWDWVRTGQVQVDGRVVIDPLTWIDLDRQQITRKDAPTPDRAAPLALALHKPRGIVSTRRDERGRRTVYDLLPAGLPWIFPAGRLDADSEGLLILTNDSSLAVRLTEPAQHLPKTYRVTIRGIPTAEALRQLRRGIELPMGPTRPVKVRVIETKHGGKHDRTELEMVLTEGRNRQIRRMWAVLGHRVERLVRVAIGAFQLGDLPPGQCRSLTETDLHHLTGKKRHPSHRSK